MKNISIKRKVLCAVLTVCMIIAMAPMGVFADEQGASQSQEAVNGATTEQSGDENVTETEEPDTEGIDNGKTTTKATTNATTKTANYKVTATRPSKIKYKWAGYVANTNGNPIVSGTTSGTKIYSNGSAQKFTMKTYAGFTLTKVTLDGKEQVDSKGKPVTSITIAAGNTADHKIATSYKRTGVFICIDAGHAGQYNRGYYSSYWESEMTWKLGNYLKTQLEKYPGVVVGMTKTSLNNDPAVYTRGTMAKGYDLFISLHSNSSSSASSDYPLSIVSSGSTLWPVASSLGKSLAAKVKTTMGTNEDYKVWIKKQNDGRDWYGVVRGAASVKVPGIILEHSFHSNAKMCKWLSNSTNLNTMAKKEAAIIAKAYGVSSSGAMSAPGATKGFNAYGYGYNSAKTTWYQVAGATGYGVYRATSKSGTYSKVATIYNSSTVSYTDTGLETGKGYYYKVRAFRYTTDGTLKWGSYSSVNGAKPIPGKPSLTLTAGDNKVTAKWSSISGATKYQLYRSTSSGGTYTRVATTASKSYANSGLGNKKTYYYKVRAYTTKANGTNIYGNFSTVKYTKTK